METLITVRHQGKEYQAHVTVEHSGVDTIISAEILDRTLTFHPNQYNGWDVEVKGDPLPDGLLDAAAWQISKGLE